MNTHVPAGDNGTKLMRARLGCTSTVAGTNLSARDFRFGDRFFFARTKSPPSLSSAATTVTKLNWWPQILYKSRERGREREGEGVTLEEDTRDLDEISSTKWKQREKDKGSIDRGIDDRGLEKEKKRLSLDAGQWVSAAYISGSVLVQLCRADTERKAGAALRLPLPLPCCPHRCKTDAFRMQLRVR